MKRKLFFYTLVCTILLSLSSIGFSQTMDYSTSKEYIIRKLSVETPSKTINKKVVITLSGLQEGMKIKIPGEDITTAIDRLWEDGVCTNIKIYHTAIEKDFIDLVIYVEENPRMAGFFLRGVKKTEADELATLLKPLIGESKPYTEYVRKNVEHQIKDYYADKNYFDTRVDFELVDDSTKVKMPEAVLLKITVDKRNKVKVGRITFEGNEHVRMTKIRKAFKDAMYERSRFDVWKDLWEWARGKKKVKQDTTIKNDNRKLYTSADSLAEYNYYEHHNKYSFYEQAIEYFRNAVRINIFTNSKYNKYEVPSSKDATIDLFNAKGYRDAKFTKDSIYLKEGDMYGDFKIEEGRQYYFRNVTWVGNKRYRSTFLDTVLNIRKGEVYNLEKLNNNLHFSQSGLDITSLYQDNGYLFFNAEPVEVRVVGDSIDLEIRIYEGKQARVGRINIYGNTKTNDYVILRELRIHPGDLFSRSAIIRSQQALSQLGIFDAQNMDVKPRPNPQDGTVDLDFYVAEAPSDQIQLSGGWGAGQLVGTLGLTFNNFSLRNMFKRKAWTPLPSGDGQKLSINAQSNGKYYQNYSFNFTEPWLGGKKPISFSLFFSHSIIDYTSGNTGSNSGYKLNSTNVGITVGKQLKWPDDYFGMSFTLAYQRFDVTNYTLFAGSSERFTGISNNIAFTAQIQRNSTNDWIFPTSGSMFSASVEATLPYSAMTGTDMKNAPLDVKYEWMEYHKWKVKGQWYIPLDRPKGDVSQSKFVLMARGEMGFLGYYNPDIGVTPFKRFFLGGDGLTGFNIDGREIIACRGYQNYSLTPGYGNGSAGSAGSAVGGGVYTKYTMELRYLISPNPQSKIYALAFLEAGNAWQDVRDFQPFKLNRSVGVGVRIFLPMFGLLGVDYGYGFDPIPGVNESQRQKGVFHFMIGQQF
jgi:outer membrane protein insertion porin family